MLAFRLQRLSASTAAPGSARLVSGQSARLARAPSLPAPLLRQAGVGGRASGRRMAAVPPFASASEPNPFRELADIVEKYNLNPARGSSSKPSSRPRQLPAQQRRRQAAANGMGNGVFALLLLNFGLFVAQQFGAPYFPSLAGWLAALPLNHWRPHWWQYVTCTFMHANWEHLSSNAFSLLVFGRMVEEEEGAFGVWATYLLAGVGGAVASYLTAPHTRTMSLGASGAVFGLFAVSIFTKFKPSLKKLLEALILGSFVARQVLNEVSVVGSGKALSVGGMSVGHAAHLAGAAVGVALVLLLARLPEGDA